MKNGVTAGQHREIVIQRDETQSTRRVTVAAIEEILYQPLPVLDHGCSPSMRWRSMRRAAPNGTPPP